MKKSMRKKKKPRTGKKPDVLRKGGPMDDRSKYDRKRQPDKSRLYSEEQEE